MPMINGKFVCSATAWSRVSDSLLDLRLFNYSMTSFLFLMLTVAL
jgi:hypothetical protein